MRVKIDLSNDVTRSRPPWSHHSFPSSSPLTFALFSSQREAVSAQELDIVRMPRQFL
ncbi:hypothetical protein BDZ94DRAFT_1268034 [Collybia nuda]|uniref:Uncharacterized protein n=1 Tax=Collybia nuda TaxID=64659 RepID=A0A9P5XXD9_9AGAR|nr:hypothetical protein BDZ94DRAFT_1268034 [Collybia nuda]